MQSSSDDCEFLTVEEAAIRLRIKTGTLYNWVNQDRIPYRKHGGRVVLEWGELQQWSKDRTKGLLQLDGGNEINESQSSKKCSLKIESKHRRKTKKKFQRRIADDLDASTESVEVDHE